MVVENHKSTVVLCPGWSRDLAGNVREWVSVSKVTSCFKDLSIVKMVEASCFGCCQGHQGLPVGFLCSSFMYC